MQLAYQYANTDQFFVGDQRNDAAGPGGQAPERKVNIFALDVIYALSNRTSLDVTVPLLSGSGGYHDPAGSSRFYSFSANGFGDIALQAEYWLSDPTKPSPIQGSVDIGIKMPTGSNTAKGTYPTGEAPLDETFQLHAGREPPVWSEKLSPRTADGDSSGEFTRRLPAVRFSSLPYGSARDGAPPQVARVVGGW